MSWVCPKYVKPLALRHLPRSAALPLYSLTPCTSIGQRHPSAGNNDRPGSHLCEWQNSAFGKGRRVTSPFPASALSRHLARIRRKTYPALRIPHTPIGPVDLGQPCCIFRIAVDALIKLSAAGEWEINAMTLVATQTTVPVPSLLRVVPTTKYPRRWRFIVIRYIPGSNLEDRWPTLS